MLRGIVPRDLQFSFAYEALASMAEWSCMGRKCLDRKSAVTVVIGGRLTSLLGLLLFVEVSSAHADDVWRTGGAI
jgi:hypothetical protein